MCIFFVLYYRNILIAVAFGAAGILRDRSNIATEIGLVKSGDLSAGTVQMFAITILLIK